MKISYVLRNTLLYFHNANTFVTRRVRHVIIRGYNLILLWHIRRRCDTCSLSDIAIQTFSYFMYNMHTSQFFQYIIFNLYSVSRLPRRLGCGHI